MALYVKQDQSKSELQDRIAAELRTKLDARGQLDYEKPIDNVTRDSHQAQNLSVTIIVIVMIVTLAVVFFAIQR